MHRAIELAKTGVGFASPNPAVGAVLVNKKGQVIGEGAHVRAGDLHAEAMAIKIAKENNHEVEGATIYMTLEPCCHQGKTPPCTDLIISEGIKEVHVGMGDEFEKVRGNGVRTLLKNGVSVVLLGEEDDLFGRVRDLNQPFIKWATTGLPYVTLKAGVTLDGKIATRTGESKWITSEAAREDARIERSSSDAVLVGAGTVQVDNPELASIGRFASKKLLRIIVDPTLSLDVSNKVFRDESVFVVCTDRASEEDKKRFYLAGIEFKSFGKEKIYIKKLLQFFGKRYIQHIFVEGGSAVHGSFHDEAIFDPLVVDRVVWYIAPKIFGGERGLSSIGGEGIGDLTSCIKLMDVRHSTIGDNIKVTGLVNKY